MLATPVLDRLGPMQPEPWVAPELVQLGRLPMHSVPHADRLELDGTWRFQLLDRPADPPGPAWRSPRPRRLDDAGLRGSAPLHERPDAVRRPSAGRPGARTRPGVYERTFELPAGWAGRRVVLHVGAAESVLIVTLNGHEIGRQQGLPPGRRVRRHRRPPAGENTLTPARGQVVGCDLSSRTRTSGGTAGSPGRCSCTRPAPVHLADIRVDAGLADDLTTGTLDLAWCVGFPGARLGARLAGRGAARRRDERLCGPSVARHRPARARRAGRSRASGSCSATRPAPRSAATRPSPGTPSSPDAPPATAAVTWRSSSPTSGRWSAEEPHLYALRRRSSPTARSPRRRPPAGRLPAGRDRGLRPAGQRRPRATSAASTATTSTSTPGGVVTRRADARPTSC